MPKSAFSKLTQLNLAREKLEAKLNREPTEKELAEYLGVSVNEIRSTESYINYLSVVSLEDIFYKSDDEDIHFKNMIKNENSPQPDKVLEEEEKVLMLKKAIDMLPEKDKLILQLYYYEKLTLKEIGKVLEITESRVSQIHSRAIVRLRENLKKLSYLE